MRLWLLAVCLGACAALRGVLTPFGFDDIPPMGPPLDGSLNKLESHVDQLEALLRADTQGAAPEIASTPTPENSPQMDDTDTDSAAQTTAAAARLPHQERAVALQLEQALRTSDDSQASLAKSEAALVAADSASSSATETSPTDDGDEQEAAEDAVDSTTPSGDSFKTTAQLQANVEQVQNKIAQLKAQFPFLLQTTASSRPPASVDWSSALSQLQMDSNTLPAGTAATAAAPVATSSSSATSRLSDIAARLAALTKSSSSSERGTEQESSNSREASAVDPLDMLANVLSSEYETDTDAPTNPPSATALVMPLAAAPSPAPLSFTTASSPTVSADAVRLADDIMGQNAPDDAAPVAYARARLHKDEVPKSPIVNVFVLKGPVTLDDALATDQATAAAGEAATEGGASTTDATATRLPDDGPNVLGNLIVRSTAENSEQPVVISVKQAIVDVAEPPQQGASQQSNTQDDPNLTQGSSPEAPTPISGDDEVTVVRDNGR